jgi:hypothetical protein
MQYHCKIGKLQNLPVFIGFAEQTVQVTGTIIFITYTNQNQAVYYIVLVAREVGGG